MQLNIVLLSGGMDSAACLIKAKEEPGVTVALTFAYGQPSLDIEMEVAAKLAGMMEVSHAVLGCEFAKGSNLLIGGKVLDKSYVQTMDNPISAAYVPGRNLAFIALALSVAAVPYGDGSVRVQDKDVKIFVGGHDSDSEPDCKPAFMTAATKACVAATKGYFKSVKVVAPFGRKTKSEIAQYLVDFDPKIIKMTISCYLGEFPGCGKCDACLMRAEAMKSVGMDFFEWKTEVAKSLKEAGERAGKNLDEYMKKRKPTEEPLTIAPEPLTPEMHRFLTSTDPRDSKAREHLRKFYQGGFIKGEHDETKFRQEYDAIPPTTPTHPVQASTSVTRGKTTEATPTKKGKSITTKFGGGNKA